MSRTKTTGMTKHGFSVEVHNIEYSFQFFLYIYFFLLDMPHLRLSGNELWVTSTEMPNSVDRMKERERGREEGS